MIAADEAAGISLPRMLIGIIQESYHGCCTEVVRQLFIEENLRVPLANLRSP